MMCAERASKKTKWRKIRVKSLASNLLRSRMMPYGVEIKFHGKRFQSNFTFYTLFCSLLLTQIKKEKINFVFVVVVVVKEERRQQKFNIFYPPEKKRVERKEICMIIITLIISYNTISTFFLIVFLSSLSSHSFSPTKKVASWNK